MDNTIRIFNVENSDIKSYHLSSLINGSVEYIFESHISNEEFFLIDSEGAIHNLIINTTSKGFAINKQKVVFPFLKGLIFLNVDCCSIESFRLLNKIMHKVNEFNSGKITSCYFKEHMALIGLDNGELYVFGTKKHYKIDTNNSSFIKFIKSIGKNRYVLYHANGDLNSVIITDDENEVQGFGRHIGWVYDLYYSKDSEKIYTCGGNGFIYVHDLVKGELLDAIPVNKGVISSVISTYNGFYVGTYDGYIFQIENKNTFESNYHFGPIWNMFHDTETNRVYTCGSDGQILELNSEDGKLLKSYSEEMNWINSVGMIPKTNTLIGTDSLGNIIKVKNRELKKHYIGEYWINNFAINSNKREIYLATAENEVVITDYFYNTLKVLTGHRDQVIDIEYSNKQQKVLSISVNGQIFIWNAANFKAEELYLKDYHFTSISINEKYNFAVIGTFQGAIVKVNLINDRVYILEKCHSGRIWKVSTNSTSKYIISICTNRELKVWDYEGNLMYTTQTNNPPTTCLMSDKQFFWADQDGNIYSKEIDIWDKSFVMEGNFLEVKNLSPPRDNKQAKLENEVIIYTAEDSYNRLYLNRYIDMFSILNIDYKMVTLKTTKDKVEIIKKTGWNRFPQVFFNSKFVGAGSVFVEMFRTKSMHRMLNNISERRNSIE